MTLYMVSYFGSLMIGPIIAGAMTEHVNWQSFWWFNVAMFAALIILILIGFPETKYVDRAKDSVTPPKIETFATDDVAAIQSTKPQPMNTEAIAEVDLWLHKGYPGKHQYPTLWFPRFTKGGLIPALIRDFWIPCKLFAFPIVQYGAFVFSWCASNFLLCNLTQSQVFAAPPYNFGAQSVGFTNFGIFAGALVGLLTAGPLSDWVAMRQTIRNNGIREPEMRLLAIIPYTVLLFLGSLIVALGYQYQWPWEVIVIIGYRSHCSNILILVTHLSVVKLLHFRP